MRVADVMTPKVISVLPHASLGEAVDIMVRSKLSGLPVINEAGSLVGIISEGDLLRRPELGTGARRAGWLESLFRPGHLAEAYARSNGRRVEEIMTPDVITISEEARLAEAARLMEELDVKRLPVMRDGKVIGIVSRSDFVRVLAGFVREVYEDQPVEDSAIKAAIEAKLKAERWAPNGTVHVTVNNGVVELGGIISDERQRNGLRVIAENTQGVKSVYDKLTWVEPYTGLVLNASA